MSLASKCPLWFNSKICSWLLSIDGGGMLHTSSSCIRHPHPPYLFVICLCFCVSSRRNITVTRFQLSLFRPEMATVYQQELITVNGNAENASVWMKYWQRCIKYDFRVRTRNIRKRSQNLRHLVQKTCYRPRNPVWMVSLNSQLESKKTKLIRCSTKNTGTHTNVRCFGLLEMFQKLSDRLAVSLITTHEDSHTQI